MRILYFVYFILKSDYRNVFQSIKCLKGHYSPLMLFSDSLWCSLKYGTSLDDYFSFRFYEKKKLERVDFATTLYMYKFHKALNDKKLKELIDDKSQYRKYFDHLAGPSEVFNVSNNEGVGIFINWLKFNEFKDIVIKDPLGTIGKSIIFASYNQNNNTFIYRSNNYSPGDFCSHYSINGKLYVEPKLHQHKSIQSLAPSALNTIRVITVLRKDGAVDIVSAAFRISIDGETDNFSTGNLAAAIDIHKGVVISKGIKRMAACSSTFEFHPVSGEKILDFKIPYWEKVKEIVKEAAHVIPEVRTVGWDVAILEDKPIIIEGNPSWNKGAPQIPLDKGIKPILDKYIGENGI